MLASLLAATHVWHFWLAALLAPLTVLAVLGTLGAYLYKVTRLRYPPSQK